MIEPGMYALLVGIRQALLAAVDSIEQYLGLPKTSDLRRALKEADRR